MRCVRGSGLDQCAGRGNGLKSRERQQAAGGGGKSRSQNGIELMKLRLAAGDEPAGMSFTRHPLLAVGPGDGGQEAGDFRRDFAAQAGRGGGQKLAGRAGEIALRRSRRGHDEINESLVMHKKR